MHRSPAGTVGTQVYNEAFARLGQRIRDERNMQDLRILAYREARHARTEDCKILVGDRCTIGGPPNDTEFLL